MLLTDRLVLTDKPIPSPGEPHHAEVARTAAQPHPENVERAKRPARVPVVLTREEIKAVLSQLSHQTWLMASLLYGAGLRLGECLRLRVKEVDFGYRQIAVRDAKGNKDRVTFPLDK
jgi:integrase